jgi:hypothetical protein
MWAAEKGGGNAAHTETLPQKRLPAQAGNVIQLRCKPTSRQFSVRPSARKSPAGAGLVAGHACRLAGPRRTHGARQARHTKTPCPQRGQDSVANGWAAGADAAMPLRKSPAKSGAKVSHVAVLGRGCTSRPGKPLHQRGAAGLVSVWVTGTRKAARARVASGWG